MVHIKKKNLYLSSLNVGYSKNLGTIISLPKKSRPSTLLLRQLLLSFQVMNMLLYNLKFLNEMVLYTPLNVIIRFLVSINSTSTYFVVSLRFRVESE
jgi:hypothetical protein